MKNVARCEHEGKIIQPKPWKGSPGLYRCPRCTMIYVKTLAGFVTYAEWRKTHFVTYAEWRKTQ